MGVSRNNQSIHLSATALANDWQKLGEVQASRIAVQPATGACQTLANMQCAQHQAKPSQTKLDPWTTRSQQKAQAF